jgi:RNA recognition motif-containing protein
LNTKIVFNDTELPDQGKKPKAAVESDEPVADTESEVDAEEGTAKAGHTKRHIQTVLTNDGTELPAKVNTKVFIDGLPYYEPKTGNSIEQSLTAFVEAWKVGKVVHFVKKEGQGFGYIAFRSPNSVETAINVLDGKKFMGRPLRVQKPKERAPDGSVPGKKDDALGQKSFVRQILLSDLPAHANADVLKEVIGEIAPDMGSKIERIKMAGKGRKAFVTMKSEADVDAAISFLNGFSLLGRIVAATKALPPGTLPFSNPALAPKVPLGAQKKDEANGPSTAGGIPLKFDYKDAGPCEIIVGNLPETVTLERLKEHFAGCGSIVEAKILMNPQTKTPNGLATIKFSVPGHAKYAKTHLDGSRIAGSVIQIERGEERSKVDLEGEKDDEDDEEIDEEGFMKHMGVTNKEEYFKNSDDEDEEIADDDAFGKKRKTQQAAPKKGKSKGKKPTNAPAAASTTASEVKKIAKKAGAVAPKEGAKKAAGKKKATESSRQGVVEFD